MQQPSVDPIQMAVNLPVFGLMPAVRTALMAAVMNRSPQIPMTTKVADHVQNGLARWGEGLISRMGGSDLDRTQSLEFLKNATGGYDPDLKGWLKDLSSPKEWRDLYQILTSDE